MNYDVVVVGGRVAGSISSLFASRNDLDVLMIEKRPEIGTPVQCAEATTFSIFDTMEIKPSQKYVCNKIRGSNIHAPDGRKIILDNINYVTLERKIFDKHLAIESARSGTDIMVMTTVKDLIKKDGRVCGVVVKHMGKIMDIKADIVIAADGIESNMAYKAGLKYPKNSGDILSCAQFEMVGLDLDPEWLNFYFGRKLAPGGYLWIFPKGDDIANLGLSVRNSKKTAYNYLKNFTKQFDATPVEINVGGVPTTGPIDKTYGDGFMVVGDAAGQVDALFGEGIEKTVTCARIAGEIAAEAVKQENTSANFLKQYEDLWKAKIEKPLRTSLRNRKIIDKLTDEDVNLLAEFIEKNTLENLSMISVIKFLGKHPHLLKLVKDFL